MPNAETVAAEYVGFVPVAIWGAVIVVFLAVYIAFVLALARDDNASANFSKTSSYAVVCWLCSVLATVVCCFVLSSSSMFVVAWLLGPFYLLAPLGVWEANLRSITHSGEL